MKHCGLSFLYCLTVLWTLATGASIPRFVENDGITRRDLTSQQVQLELGCSVSKTTVIYGPDSDRFENATSRWTDSSKPDIEIVIEPGTEADVAKIVKYCNKNSIDFLATSGRHGLSSTLRTFNGIQINMRSLNHIKIEKNKKKAWFGGGLIVGEVIHYLWDEGFVTTTGGCECVGMLGAGLGGGHGRYEGLYGMISDNIYELNVVLGNGETVRVNSKSHKDLLWGMKGAGHNLGIVTSYQMKIFPRGEELWHYHNYIWRGDQLEPVFEAFNEFHGDGTTPLKMAYNVGTFLMNSTISEDEPVMFWTFAYRGPREEAEKLLEPFNNIEPAWQEEGDVPYSGIAAAQATGMDDPLCDHGSVHATSTAGLRVYNLTAERLIYDGFKKRAIEDPALAAGVGILHEGYSTAGVENIDSKTSSYPFRDDRHLMLFNAQVPDGDTEREKAAWAWAAEVRDQWNEGQPERTVNAYVNYAAGTESLEERYGHESWRLKKLKKLKARYDPDNRFRFYNPIIVD